MKTASTRPLSRPARTAKKIGISMAMAIWVGSFAEGAGADQAKPLPHERQELLKVKPVKEPSGICHHDQRNTLFVVDDGGLVCEFKPDGSIVNRKRIRSADFEGITHDPSTGLLYIAVEGEEILLEVDPDTFEVRFEFAIPRTFQGRTVMAKGGQGIEAITFVPDDEHPPGGTFFVANQSMDLKDTEDISAIFELEVPLRADRKKPSAVKILRYFPVQVTDLSGLHYDRQGQILYALSDANDRMMAYTRAGKLLSTWNLPGEDQEGVTVDQNGVMFIAQDSGDVLKLKIDWRKMQARQ